MYSAADETDEKFMIHWTFIYEESFNYSKAGSGECGVYNTGLVKSTIKNIFCQVGLLQLPYKNEVII